MNKDKALKYISTNNLIGIKAGQDRLDFLDIWMVIVQERIFARSWGLAENSWYNAFLKDSTGQIRCGDMVYDIKAMIPDDIHQLANDINQAYLTKYDRGENRPYATGIIEEKHVEKTMEFVVCEA